MKRIRFACVFAFMAMLLWATLFAKLSSAAEEGKPAAGCHAQALQYAPASMAPQLRQFGSPAMA